MPASSPPQPPPGGNLKYLLIGLAFLGGAAALWIVASRPKPAEPVIAPPPPAVERVNPMAKQELELAAPDQPDAGPPPAEPTAIKRHVVHAAGEWECSGDVPQAVALRIINDNRPQIRSCYERRLKVNNVLQGEVRLKLKIGPNGKVLATATAGSLRDEAVFACVRNLAQTWTFPVPSGGVCAVVQAPFQFAPKP